MTHPSAEATAGGNVALGSLQHRRLQLRLGLRCAGLLVVVVLFASWGCVDAATAVGTFDPQHCVKCDGLQYCTIMNGQYLFDPIVGYSREATPQLEKQGVCEDMDAKTLALSPFGNQVQFKDTAACHKLVWNFHCLSWVATTFQREVNGTQCVYSHFYRLYLDEVCGNIGCLSEIQEAKQIGSTDTKVAETTCVSGSWVYAENKTLSRCSSHTYEPPESLAIRAAVGKVMLVLSVAIVVWVV
ncbi:uncharacterized protein KRP23_15102 [Phytophthora ramorum]|uniref:uncharacterized protein n=1 Tax=Phytophthora ramorum TaxID=164328 RepID=UPI00309F48A7|nr:hypothetical protein KRP23_15102 [Phytophthora ramorum]